MKPVKIVFSHFCKENNLTAYKSTLFEDKPKYMEEMTLHKWLVFCKEFDIFDKLCRMEIDKKHKGSIDMSSSVFKKEVKEQVRVK